MALTFVIHEISAFIRTTTSDNGCTYVSYTSNTSVLDEDPVTDEASQLPATLGEPVWPDLTFNPSAPSRIFLEQMEKSSFFLRLGVKSSIPSHGVDGLYFILKGLSLME